MSDTATVDYTITQVTTVPAAAAEHAWELYEISAAELRRRAAARHVMTRDEFDEFIVSDRVIKLLATAADGSPAGMALLTNELHTVEWISPEFFECRYPTHAAANTLYYLAFVAVRPDRRGQGLLPRMVYQVARIVHGVGGVVCFDVCQFNDEVLPIKDIACILMTDEFTFDIRQTDSQRWYTVYFDGET